MPKPTKPTFLDISDDSEHFRFFTSIFSDTYLAHREGENQNNAYVMHNYKNMLFPEND